MYIHELHDWPNFRWDQAAVSKQLASVRLEQGRLLGRIANLGKDLGAEANLQILTQDVIKTSQIEGEAMDADQVRSSLARRLGLDPGDRKGLPRNREGMVLVLLDATRDHAKALTAERLFGWHKALFPTGQSGLYPITTGAWRGPGSGPMQVVSGPLGHETVHFEAPVHSRLPKEMVRFLRWFEQTDTVDLVLKSALAHFYFVTLHPFDDGNGRLARALSDLCLARSEGSAQRFYSLSWQIQRERKDYYRILERSQKADLDISAWLHWYLQALSAAIAGSQEVLESVMQRADYWKRHGEAPMNARQRSMVNRLLAGFEGKLTSTKWAKLEHCSHDTALRDIQALIELKMMKKDAAGSRSTSYSLVLRPGK